MANSKASGTASKPRSGGKGAKNGSNTRRSNQYTGKPARTATEVIAEAARPKSNLWYCIPAFIIPFVLTLISNIAFGVYPFGERSVLTLDLNGQYIYYFESLRDAFWGDGSVFYNWSRNLSGGFMGIIGYYLASPFTLIIMLLPRKMIIESMMIMQMCKVGACGATFCVYAQRSKHVAPIPSVMFSTMYSMMSYVVIQLIDPMWIDGPIFLPLIILGVEYLIDDGRKINYIIPLALMFIANFYIGFMIAIFVALYFFYYLFFGTERKFRDVKEYFYTFATMGIATIVVLICSMFMILPVYNALALGKFDFSEPDYSNRHLFAPLELVPCMLPNQYYSVNVDEDTLFYGRPEIYSGVMSFIMLPLYFMNKKIKLNKKIGSGLLLFVMFMSMYVKPINMMWHGGQDPNWLPYRYSFIVSFILVAMAAELFSKLDGYKISLEEVFTTVVLFVALIMPFIDDSVRVLKPIFFYSLIVSLIAINVFSIVISKLYRRNVTYLEKLICFAVILLYFYILSKQAENLRFYVINSVITFIIEIVTLVSFVSICRNIKKKNSALQYIALAGIMLAFVALCVFGVGVLASSGAIDEISDKIISRTIKIRDKNDLASILTVMLDIVIYLGYFPVIVSSIILALTTVKLAKDKDYNGSVFKLAIKLGVTEVISMVALFLLELIYFTVKPIHRLTNNLFTFSIIEYNESKYQYPAVKPYKDFMEHGSDKWEEIWLGTMFFGAFLAAIYLIYLFAYSRTKKKSQKTLITCIVAAVVIFEGGYNCYDSFRKVFKEVGNSDKSTYTEILSGKDVVEELEDYDGGFYRSEKTYTRMVNDNIALGLKGLTHSSSVMNTKAIKFIEAMGYFTQSFESKYEGSNPVADSILGIKYVLDDPERAGNPKMLDASYIQRFSSTYKKGDNVTATVNVYENPNALSIGYMADDDIARLTGLGNDDPFNSLNNFLSAMTGNTDLSQSPLQPKAYYKRFPVEVSYDNTKVYLHDYINPTTGAVHDCYEAYADAGDAVVNIHLTVPKTGDVYMHLGSEIRKSCNVWVSDTKDENGNYYGHTGYGTYFNNNSSPIVRIGPYNEGTEIEVRLTIISSGDPNHAGGYVGANEYIMVRKEAGFNFYYLDQEAFEEDINILKQNQWQIDPEKSNDRYLEGKITAKKGQIMMTTIPYEPGWEIKVDGKKLDDLVIEKTDEKTGKPYYVNDSGSEGEIIVLGSLIGIRLPEGEHTVTMKYTPPGFRIGAVTFFIGIICIVLLYLFDRKNNTVLKERIAARKRKKLGLPEKTEEAASGKKKNVQIIKSKGAVDGDISEAAKKKAQQAKYEAEKIASKNEELLEKGKAYAEKSGDIAEKAEKVPDKASETVEEVREEATEITAKTAEKTAKAVNKTAKKSGNKNGKKKKKK